jgi:hypothetical protein
MNNFRRLAGSSSASLVLFLALTSLVAVPASGQARPTGISDAELVHSLQGYKSDDADVNGIRLHYVEGGKGRPLVLLPG